MIVFYFATTENELPEAREVPGRAPFFPREPAAVLLFVAEWLRMIQRKTFSAGRPGQRPRRRQGVVAATTVAILFGAGEVASSSERWYEPRHAEAGAPIYAMHCGSCHGVDGAGASNWRRRDAEGYYPPPPLNGTGHAWHHPLRQLFAMIHDGSPAGEGRMPAWRGRLARGEILAVIARFQSWWSDDIYRAWSRMNRASGAADRSDQSL